MWLDSDSGDASSEIREARGKRNKGEPSRHLAAKKNHKSINKGKAKVPCNSDEEDSMFAFYENTEEDEDPESILESLVHTAKNDSKKLIKSKAKKMSSRIESSFGKLLLDIKCGMMEAAEHNKKGPSIQKMVEVFDKAKDTAKKKVMDQAMKACTDLEGLIEKLFEDVEYEVMEPIEENNGEGKKK